MAHLASQTRAFVVTVLATLSILFTLASIIDVSVDVTHNKSSQLSLHAPDASNSASRTNSLPQTSDCPALHYSLPTADRYFLFPSTPLGSVHLAFQTDKLRGVKVPVFLRPPILRS